MAPIVIVITAPAALLILVALLALVLFIRTRHSPR